MATVAERLACVLDDIGVKYVFGVPGGPWIDYMEAFRNSQTRFVLVSHETSAAVMADVCGRITGIPGACHGTFGPGATNLLTGVAGSLLDRSPVLAFTQEVPDAMLGRTTQMGIDHQALFRPVTKWTTRLDPAHLETTLHRAAQIATSEVPGPVHIGLPSDVASLAAGLEDKRRETLRPIPTANPTSLDEMRAALRVARKPLLAVGLTAVRANVQSLILQIAERQQIPVVLTPMAKGIVPEHHRSYAGILFHALSDYVAETHDQADLVLAVGYDPIEYNYEQWLPAAPLVHIDTRPADLDPGAHGPACDVVGNLATSLQQLAALPAQENDWDLDRLADRRTRMFDRFRPHPGSFGPTMAMSVLRELLPADGIMTCDVGAHTHLIGQMWPTPEPGLQIMTNGWSSMGFGIPAAIAAKLCRPDRPVACVVGDGGFLMTVGELATAKRLGLPVVFVLLTDHHLTLIQIKQERRGFPPYGTPLHDDRYQSAHTYFGVPVLTAHDEISYRAALREGFDSDGPVVVEAFIDPSEYRELVLRGSKQTG